MADSAQIVERAKPSDDSGNRAEKLLAVARGLTFELHPRKRGAVRVSLESRLDRDLGIDSLVRAELILRVERAFRVRLPDSLLGEAETLDDILNALDTAEQAVTATARPAEVAYAPELPMVAGAPEAARTLIEVLQWHVGRHPRRPHVTVLQDHQRELRTLTYQELATEARAIGKGLRRLGVEAGARVSIMLPTSADFFTTFFGILYAGAVPVPIYPPFRLAQLEEHLRRQAGILRNAGASLLVTTEEARAVAGLLRLQVEDLGGVETPNRLCGGPDVPLPPVRDGEAVALIQYTSGSTGDPKGVVLSHANLLANIRAMGEAMEGDSADVFVSWLPLYHDMGLIGAWLGSLYYAAPLYVMSPLTFLVRPEAWLWAVHRYRATLSAAPNFGFELCLKKVEDEMIEGLDLSSLRMVANGAEPVSPNTIRRFTERFQKYGFKPGAMAPVYGLAESAVGLAFPPPGRPPPIDRINREALSRHGVAEPVPAGQPGALEFAACGRVLRGHEVRIVDDTGHEVAERHEGRLEFRGPSTTRGYFRNEEKTRALFDGDWLDSGDRGYVSEGDIYITGRIKDIIVRAGRNIYPHEMEEAVGAVPGVRKGCVAVFGSPDPATGSERLIVLAETREIEPARLDEIRQRIGELSVDLLGTPPEDIVLALPRTVPKTSSGKIRRAAAKELYEAEGVGSPRRALWFQVMRLGLAGIMGRLRSLNRMVGKYLYAGYWWSVIGPALALIWLLVLALPVLGWRWRTTRGIARLALWLAGTRVSVAGLHHLPAGGAVLASNHASYLDPLVLSAVLPGEPVFVAKRELAPQFFAGPLLRRLGVLFVQRGDPESGIAHAEVARALGRRGRLVVSFPEGTFGREPGLLPFRLGAFVVAADAGLPVIPAGLRGTRSILRGGHWFPLRGSAHIEIGPPIEPAEQGFAGALALRKAARKAILQQCGEPDLGEGED